MVRLKKVEVDPRLAAIRGGKAAPVNLRMIASDSKGYWIGDIMANRHRAGRPSFRALLGEEHPTPYFRRLYRAAAGPRGDEKWANGGTPIRD